MGELFASLCTPTVRDIFVHWEGAESESYPRPIPDLYLGEPVVASARLDRLAESVVIRGRTASGPFMRRIEFSDVQPDSDWGLGRLWARRKVQALLDAEREGALEEARPLVLALGLRHELVTPFTSFIAVDGTPTRQADQPLDVAQLPTPTPQMKPNGLGRLPSGAAGHELALWSGLLCLMLAWVARRRQA